jgi:membrane protein YdbS with pleckstrin-like domain
VLIGVIAVTTVAVLLTVAALLLVTVLVLLVVQVVMLTVPVVAAVLLVVVVLFVFVYVFVVPRSECAMRKQRDFTQVKILTHGTPLRGQGRAGPCPATVGAASSDLGG